MSIRIGQYTFEGPYSNTAQLDDRAGVYAILCSHDGKYDVVDVGESAQIRTRVENHDRKDCWQWNCAGTLMVAAYYTPHLQSAGRVSIEQEIRARYNPPCGER
ncbi:hypothetical protein JCM19992_21830 [Thermostilla marina]